MSCLNLRPRNPAEKLEDKRPGGGVERKYEEEKKPIDLALSAMIIANTGSPLYEPKRMETKRRGMNPTPPHPSGVWFVIAIKRQVAVTSLPTIVMLATNPFAKRLEVSHQKGARYQCCCCQHYHHDGPLRDCGGPFH